ncbi:MAG: NAD(P)/FAD-dependent oxidoreductase [Gammaproteobacteria bacterium]|nr:NAD(P)/FAD-dependent oxidoreductase [Gammaproteobacteria bacterium]
MREYDVIIIGSGTAGQTAAFELRSHGLQVAVVEQSKTPGGTCALAGCQAKKWFYEGMETAARAHHLLHKGVISPPAMDWQAFLNEKNRFTSGVPKGTLNGFKKAGIDVIEGSAKFIDDNRIDCNGEQYSAESFIIATGAKPLNLAIEGAEYMISSDHFLELTELPPRFVFVGGGFISFEFAHFVARLNEAEQGQITILEVASRPLGPFDADMVEQLMLASEMEDIDILTDVNITSIEKSGSSYLVKLADETVIEADVVVNGAGRQPVIEGLALDQTGINYNRRGIAVDENMRTSKANIFAVGDCAATIQLARVADYESLLAANTILGDKGNADWPAIDYKLVPAMLFTYPQYGMVGHTEQALIDAGIEYIKSEDYDLGWPSYRRIGMEHAAYKILASPDGYLLGAHFLSDQASGLVTTIRLAMLNGVTVDKLYHQIMMAPYPTRESDMTYMIKPLINS